MLIFLCEPFSYLGVNEICMKRGKNLLHLDTFYIHYVIKCEDDSFQKINILFFTHWWLTSSEFTHQLITYVDHLSLVEGVFEPPVLRCEEWTTLLVRLRDVFDDVTNRNSITPLKLFPDICPTWSSSSWSWLLTIIKKLTIARIGWKKYNILTCL